MIYNEDNKKEDSMEGVVTGPDIKRYETDVSGVSLNNLKIGLWLAKRKGIFKNSVLILFGAVAVSLAVYGLFGIGYYYLKGAVDDKKMVAEMVSIKTVPQEFLLERAAKNLAISSLSVIDNKGSYDLYVELKNQNLKHWGIVDYCFKSGEKELECGKGFILPNEKKYFTALELKSEDRLVNPKFIVNDVVWKKLDPHKIFNWEAFKSERLKIKIEDITFNAGASSELSEKININQLSFSIKNQSAYGFWEAPLEIILYRNDRIAGISRYVLKEFSSYDERKIDMSLVGEFSGVNKISILPYINIMDDNNYLKPGR